MLASLPPSPTAEAVGGPALPIAGLDAVAGEARPRSADRSRVGEVDAPLDAGPRRPVPSGLLIWGNASMLRALRNGKSSEAPGIC